MAPQNFDPARESAPLSFNMNSITEQIRNVSAMVDSQENKKNSEMIRNEFNDMPPPPGPSRSATGSLSIPAGGSSMSRKRKASTFEIEIKFEITSAPKRLAIGRPMQSFTNPDLEAGKRRWAERYANIPNTWKYEDFEGATFRTGSLASRPKETFLDTLDVVDIIDQGARSLTMYSHRLSNFQRLPKVVKDLARMNELGADLEEIYDWHNQIWDFADIAELWDDEKGDWKDKEDEDI